MDVRVAWVVVVGEERDARFAGGRATVVVEVRFEGDFRQRVEEEVEVRRDDEDES